MAWFVISLDYQVPINEVDLHLRAHRDYQLQYYSEAKFLFVGRKVPRTGDIIIIRAKDKATIENLIQQDPFHQKGIATFTIMEFEPTLFPAELNVADLIVTNEQSIRYE